MSIPFGLETISTLWSQRARTIVSRARNRCVADRVQITSSPSSPAPPHGSAPPVQALVARALQKSMVNQTPLALHSAPVPLKVYQASFVVKVRVVPAQPALSCASPPPELSLRPYPSVWAAAEQGKTAALQTAVLYDVVCCCEMLCMDGVH